MEQNGTKNTIPAKYPEKGKKLFEQKEKLLIVFCNKKTYTYK
jgi:hypothetical protein